MARTKFLAKVAGGVAKPDGLLVVPHEGELACLHPLPVERLWGVGAVTAGKLRARGITTVGQVAQVGEAELVWLLGPAAGRHLHALAHNHDPSPVQVARRRRSIGAQRALGKKRRSPEELDAILAALIDRVARRLRSAVPCHNSTWLGDVPFCPHDGRAMLIDRAVSTDVLDLC